MVPAVNLANQIGWVALFLGLVLFYRSSTLLVVGGVMLLVVLAFQLITLPVELNASSRALKILRADGMIMEQERPMASTMLKAAAFTYVAGVLSTLAADPACLFDRGITRPPQLTRIKGMRMRLSYEALKTGDQRTQGQLCRLSAAARLSSC